MTGEPVELLWVKGSGGDLGTLTESGLAVLRLDRAARARRRLPRRRPRGRDGRRVRLLPARQGRRGPVDRHRHARARRCRARRPPASGLRHRVRDRGGRREAHHEGLRRQGRLGAVASPRLPARARHRRDQAKNPEAIGCILGGHGITAWGDTSDEAEKNSSGSSRPPQAYIAAQGQEEPVRHAPSRRTRALPPAERRAKAAALAPTIRGLASHDRPKVGHFTDDPRVLDFLASAEGPAPRRARHELPRPLPAHQGQADAARPAGRAHRSRTRSRG